MYQGTKWVILKQKKTELKISCLGTFNIKPLFTWNGKRYVYKGCPVKSPALAEIRHKFRLFLEDFK
jgi:hypothetical protein